MQICVHWKCMKSDIFFTYKKSPCFQPVKTKEKKEESKQKTLRFIRSSLPEVFCKKGVLRNLTKFTGKHLFHSLFFNKGTGLRPETLLKRLWNRCFPVSFTKFLWKSFLTEQLRWLLLFYQIKNKPIQITRSLKSSN